MSVQTGQAGTDRTSPSPNGHHRTDCPPVPDQDAIAAFAANFMEPGCVYEVRVPKSKREGPRRLFGVNSGYFDNPQALAREAARISGADAEAVYVTLNPVNPDLLARAVNRIKGQNPATTADDQIERRRNLLIDVDPVRPTGISATLDEWRAAIRRRDEIAEFLSEQLAWPAPRYKGSSGNGGQLIYGIDQPNDADTADLLANVLLALDAIFSDDVVTIDTTVFNASRITKLAGTVAAKGDHTESRPWRLAQGRIDATADTVGRAQLEALAADAPKPEPTRRAGVSGPTPSGRTRSWNVGDVLSDSGIKYVEKQKGGSTIYKLDRCLTSDDHTDGACIIERPDGMLLYKCHHDRCQGTTWHDVKDKLRIPTATGQEHGRHESTESPGSDASGATTGIALADFGSYLPDRKYIYLPTGKMWEPEGVNRAFPPINKVKQSTLIDAECPIHDMTWAPGKPQIIKDAFLDQGGWIRADGARVYNHYRSPAVQGTEPYQAGRWLDLLERVYPDDAEHVVRWFAHRVQRPGEKLNHALVLGGTQGIGKDSILEPVRYAVGPQNFGDVSPEMLTGRFNAFLKTVMLRVSELRDLGDRDRYGFYEHTKTLIAAPPETVLIDEKNVRAYRVPNLVGVVFTTNHRTDGLFLPEDDRRHYVAWSDAQPADFEPGFWTDFYAWLEAGGRGHVAAFLAEVDLDSFDPKAPPPKTNAFWDIVTASRAPEDDELSDALSALGDPDAVTIEDIVAKCKSIDFKSWMQDRRNARQIPHRFEACGYVSVQNPTSTDRRWKVNGRNQTIYAKRTLSIRDRTEAAQTRARRSW